MPPFPVDLPFVEDTRVRKYRYGIILIKRVSRLEPKEKIIFATDGIASRA